MSFFIPQPYFAPSRCSGTRCGPRQQQASSSCGPRRSRGPSFWDILDESINEVQRVTRETQPSFNPRFDVTEHEDSYKLKGDLPGVEQKNISVEFPNESSIEIKGHTESETRAAEGNIESADANNQQSEKTNNSTSPDSDAGSVKTLQATVEDEKSGNDWVDVPGEDKSEPKKKEVETKNPAPTIEKTRPQSWVSERRQGEFSRSFKFPVRVDRDAVTATLKNGVLEITVPKVPAPAVKNITIN